MDNKEIHDSLRHRAEMAYNSAHKVGVHNLIPQAILIVGFEIAAAIRQLAEVTTELTISTTVEND